jgi:hypothetical protein
MSGLVKFVIHYGYGAVRSSDAGADLSDFEYHEVEFTDPPYWGFQKDVNGVLRMGS